MKNRIKPIGDRVLVRPYTKDEMNKGKATFMMIKNDEKTSFGEVLAVSDTLSEEIKVGDTVVFTRYSYEEVDENTYILNVKDLLALYK